MSGSTKKKYCKLLHAITNHALLSVSEEAMQEEEVDKIIKAAQDSKLFWGEQFIAFKVVTYGQLEQDCLGAWCPARRIPGLILIHAWNPNDMNTLTSVCGIFIFTIVIILFTLNHQQPMQDHVKCHFVRPAVDSVSGGGREEVARKEENRLLKLFRCYNPRFCTQ